MADIDVKDDNTKPVDTVAPVEEATTAPVLEAQPVPPEVTDSPTPEAKPEPDPEAAPAPVVETPPRKNAGAKYGHYAAEAILLLAVVVLGLQVTSAKADNKNLQTQLASAKENPQALVQKQSDDLIARVGALMKLPAGETPTVADVSDAAAAAKQSAFFANAQNGDKVLMYVKAGEAILYRPTTNKIILVAPLTFNNAQANAKQ